jgi:hypothetical protein
MFCLGLYLVKLSYEQLPLQWHHKIENNNNNNNNKIIIIRIIDRFHKNLKVSKYVQ